MKSKQLVNVNGRVIRMALATALAVGGATGVNSYAGQQTANLSVTARVDANCTIAANSAVAFGAYDPIVTHASANLDEQGSLTVKCTSGATPSPKITLGQGLHDVSGSAAAPVRRMSNGSSFLSYSLYSDPARTVVWGNTSDTGLVYDGNGTAQTINVYGRVGMGQNVPVGNYSDTVVATVTF